MNDVQYLCCVSDEEIAEAIEERKREARAAFLALHPECIDAEMVTTGYERDGGHIDVTVRIVPLRKPDWPGI
jgi:quinolinate synthase